MKEYIKSISRQISRFSQSLNKTALFIEQPWAMVNEEFEIQKLIFKKDGELILSRNGKVDIGCWEYLPEARSLLIDRGRDKILCNEVFIDKGVMVLKLDGTDSEMFMLANQNVLPDLNVVEYLKRLRSEKLNLQEVPLEDGRTLEVSAIGEDNRPAEFIKAGQSVYLPDQELPDGDYLLADKKRIYRVGGGKLQEFFYLTRIRTKNGVTLTVERRSRYLNSLDDRVFINHKTAEDGRYRMGWLSKIVVANGRIIEC